MSFYNSRFYRFISGDTDFSREMASTLSSFARRILSSISGKYLGTNLTGAQKEAADLQLSNQQTLNEEEFDRKVKFHQMFETYPAQVRQMEEANLNPALMYGSGAGVSASGGIGSAGSASMPSSDGVNVLSSVLSTIVDLKRLSIDKDLRNRQIDVQEERNRLSEHQQEYMRRYYNALAFGAEQKNSVFDSLFDLDVRYKNALIGRAESEVERNTILNQVSNEQLNYLSELSKTEDFKRRMYESQIGLNDAGKAVAGVQKAILEAQKNYTDEYFSAVAKLQSIAAEQAEWRNNNIFKPNYDKMKQAAISELSDIILRAGIDAKSFQYFEKMTPKDWTKVISGLIGVSIGTAGAVVGRAISAGAHSAAGAVSAPFVLLPTTQQWLHANGIDPYM